MFEEHPTVEELIGFLQDASRPGHAARNARILRHLLAECPACGGQLQAMGWPARRLERLVHRVLRLRGPRLPWRLPAAPADDVESNSRRPSIFRRAPAPSPIAESTS